MNGVGEGEFLLLSKASIAYPSEWNIKRQPGVNTICHGKKAEDFALQQNDHTPESNAWQN